MERERETVDEKKEDQDETFVIQDTGSDDEESHKLRQMMSQKGMDKMKSQRTSSYH